MSYLPPGSYYSTAAGRYVLFGDPGWSLNDFQAATGTTLDKCLGCNGPSSYLTASVTYDIALGDARGRLIPLCADCAGAAAQGVKERAGSVVGRVVGGS